MPYTPPPEYTKTQLRQMARERGLQRYSRLRKSELIELIKNPPLPEYTKTQLRQMARERGLRRYSRLRKYQLLHLLKEIDNINKRNKKFKVKKTDYALKKFANVYTIDGKVGFDPQSFLDGARENMVRVLRDNRNTKVKLILICYMDFPSRNEIKLASFHSCIEVNLAGTNEEDVYDTMVGIILENIVKYMAMGSDVRFHSIIQLEIHTVSYNSLRGETYIPLPKELAKKGAIINVQNKGNNKCFLWCVLRALNPKENHPERIDEELKGKVNTLNMKGIDYPVSLKDIDEFEKQNPSMSITVFGYDGKSVYPLRNSDNTDRDHNIVLMLIEEDGVKHYCLVKNPSRLLTSQVSKRNGKKYFCFRCLNPFWSLESLNKHKEHCNEHEAVKIEVPKKGTMLEFKNYYRSEKVPFIVYADFECYIKPLQTCEPYPKSNYTKQYQKHEPFSFCYYIKCFDNEIYKPELVSYTGEDAAQKFVEMLKEHIREITRIPYKEMIFGKEEKEQFDQQTKCWICKEKFGNSDKVRDHCHFTGKYRGAAHKFCNLKYKRPNFTPVIFHNLSGYDSHLLIKSLRLREGNIDCIPNNEEKYISFTKKVQVGYYRKEVKNEKGETTHFETRP